MAGINSGSKKVRARFKYKGVDYEKTFPSSRSAKEWLEDTRSKLKRAPDGISLEKGKWVASFDGNTGEIFRSFSDFAEAVLWLDNSKAEMRAGVFAENGDPGLTVSTYFTTWLEENHSISAKTKLDYRSLMVNHILPYLGSITLSSLTRKDAHEWVNKLTSKKVGKTTIKRSVGLVKQVMKTAHEHEIIPRNPVAFVKYQEPPRGEKEFLDIDQLLDLADVCGPPYGNLIVFLGMTGLRINEALALEVKDVSFKKGRIKVDKAFAVSENYSREIGPTKTRQTRSVPIPPNLSPYLEACMRGKKPSEPLFNGPQGGPLQDSWFRKRVFAPAVKKMGYKGISPHSLRHTFASLLLDQNAPIPVVSSLLGHSSSAVTMAVYAHSIKKADEEWVDKLDEVMAKSAGKRRDFDYGEKPITRTKAFKND